MKSAHRGLGHIFISGNLVGLPQSAYDVPVSKMVSSDGSQFSWSPASWDEETRFQLEFVTTEEGRISFDGEQDTAELTFHRCRRTPGCPRLSKSDAMDVLGAKALRMLLELDRILSRDIVDQWCSKRLTETDLALITAEFPVFMLLEPADRNRFGRAGTAFAKAFVAAKASERDRRETARIDRRLNKLFDELPLGTPLLSQWSSGIATLDGARPGMRTKHTLFYDATPVSQAYWVTLSPALRRRCRILTPEAAKALPAGQIGSHRLLELLRRAGSLDPKFNELRLPPENRSF